MPLRHRFILAATALVLASVPAPSTAAQTPRGKAIVTACAGAVAIGGRKVSNANKLKLGQDPKACFGRMQIYEGPDHQYVVVAPSASCPGGKALDVYGKSRAGPWYAYFEKPVCGGFRRSSLY